MTKVTAEEFAEKHARRLKGALQDIRTGIQRVTVSPTAEAVKKQDKMRVRLNQAIDSGKWANRTRKVTLEDWRNKAATVGVDRIPGGIDAATAKVTDFARQLLPAVDAARAKVKAMPDVTLEDSINRMNTYVREMAKFKKQ